MEMHSSTQQHALRARPGAICIARQNGAVHRWRAFIITTLISNLTLSASLHIGTTHACVLIKHKQNSKTTVQHSSTTLL